MAKRCMGAVLLLAGLLLPWGAAAQDCGGKASFDCAQAKLPDEILICSSPETRAADCRLNQAFDAVMWASTRADNDKRLRREERNWIAQRNQTCGTSLDDATRGCFVNMTLQRLQALQTGSGVTSTPPAPRPSASALAKPSGDSDDPIKSISSIAEQIGLSLGAGLDFIVGVIFIIFIALVIYFDSGPIGGVLRGLVAAIVVTLKIILFPIVLFFKILGLFASTPKATKGGQGSQHHASYEDLKRHNLFDK
jgi:uncharacterized protein